MKGPRHLAALAVALAFPLAQAQTSPFPARPLTFVVPCAPGGGHDTMARIVAERLSAQWKQPARGILPASS
jgi:tripartite-type tricarboxylate transporter receptor subunit TctC